LSQPFLGISSQLPDAGSGCDGVVVDWYCHGNRLSKTYDMGAPRRSSSRISHRNVALVHQTQKKKHQEELERLASIKKKRKPMEVFVQILTGRCISLSVSLDDTIEEVSEKIKMKEGINPDQQTLLFNGLRLYEDATVDEYHIYEGSKLFLTVRGLGG
jgi:hypothetical protein